MPVVSASPPPPRRLTFSVVLTLRAPPSFSLHPPPPPPRVQAVGSRPIHPFAPPSCLTPSLPLLLTRVRETVREAVRARVRACVSERAMCMRMCVRECVLKLARQTDWCGCAPTATQTQTVTNRPKAQQDRAKRSPRRALCRSAICQPFSPAAHADTSCRALLALP
eukprot:6181891-Pleurochrysis_carterae.AAC.1